MVAGVAQAVEGSFRASPPLHSLQYECLPVWPTVIQKQSKSLQLEKLHGWNKEDEGGLQVETCMSQQVDGQSMLLVH